MGLPAKPLSRALAAEPLLMSFIFAFAWVTFAPTSSILLSIFSSCFRVALETALTITDLSSSGKAVVLFFEKFFVTAADLALVKFLFCSDKRFFANSISSFNLFLVFSRACLDIYFSILLYASSSIFST